MRNKIWFCGHTITIILSPHQEEPACVHFGMMTKSNLYMLFLLTCLSRTLACTHSTVEHQTVPVRLSAWMFRLHNNISKAVELHNSLNQQRQMWTPIVLFWIFCFLRSSSSEGSGSCQSTRSKWKPTKKRNDLKKERKKWDLVGVPSLLQSFRRWLLKSFGNMHYWLAQSKLCSRSAEKKLILSPGVGRRSDRDVFVSCTNQAFAKTTLHFHARLFVLKKHTYSWTTTSSKWKVICVCKSFIPEWHVPGLKNHHYLMIWPLLVFYLIILLKSFYCVIVCSLKEVLI